MTWSAVFNQLWRRSILKFWVYKLAETLFEAGGAVFIKNSLMYCRKILKGLRVKVALKHIFSHLKNIWPTKRHLIIKVPRKTVAKSLSGPCCTARNSLHLHQQNRLRFSNSKNCFFSQRMNNHIIRLSSLRFLVVAFFAVRAEFQATVKCCLER